MSLYLAFDIGGTDVKWGLIDEEGEIRLQDQYSSNHADGDAILQGMENQYKKYAEQIKGVAISAPGFVDPVRGYLETGGAIRSFYDFPMKAYLEERMQVPVTVENDVNCVALAEKWKGNAQQDTDFLCLTIGTGVGGALFLRNELYRGHGFRAGEFGFMITQGLHNHVPAECTMSRVGAMRALREKYAMAMNLSPHEVTGFDVFAAYDRQEPIAVHLVGMFLQNIAIGIYNLCYILNPKKILIGGGITSRETLLAEIKGHLAYLGLTEKEVELDLCHFRNNAGIVGAVYHHLQQLSK
ncbi:MAG TPA: ROK family protein [Candidatus Bathyarchaeia archaeon]|nr:ROK family protein [Candidatus Bathyarchaeia archaeon]